MNELKKVINLATLYKFAGSFSSPVKKEYLKYFFTIIQDKVTNVLRQLEYILARHTRYFPSDFT